MVRILAHGWSSDLRNLLEINFFQLYDFYVVSTRKYRHIVLRGTYNEKLKSSQFFFEGNVNKAYVRANFLHSMKKISPTCDVLSAA